MELNFVYHRAVLVVIIASLVFLLTQRGRLPLGIRTAAG